MMESMGSGIAYYLMMMAELMVTAVMFSRKLTKRRHWPLFLGLSMLAVAGIIILTGWLKDVRLGLLYADRVNKPIFMITYLAKLLTQIMILVLYGGVLLCVFDTSLFNAVFISCTAIAIQNISQCLYMIHAFARDDAPLFSMHLLAEPANLLRFLLFFAAVYLLCYYFFVRDSELAEDFLNRRILSLMIGMILVNLVLGSVAEPHNSEPAMRLFAFMLIARILICIMALIMQYDTMQWVRRQLHEEQLNHLLQAQRDQYEIAKENIDTVNINAHDLRHQIHVIMNAIRQNGPMESVESELSDMEKGIDMVDTAYRTGNSALDVALTEKARICIARSIQLSAIADGSALGFMNDVDIYTMFGNALDNAIEAVSQIEQADGRIISLSIHRDKRMISIHLENTCCGQPAFKNGLPQTSKQNKRFHGYGLRSIMHVAEKYQGNVRLSAQSGVFCLDILIPAALI